MRKESTVIHDNRDIHRNLIKNKYNTITILKIKQHLNNAREYSNRNVGPSE